MTLCVNMNVDPVVMSKTLCCMYKKDSNSSQPYIVYYSAMYFVICFSVSLNIFSIYKDISHKTPGKSKHWYGNDLKCRLPVRHYTLTGLC